MEYKEYMEVEKFLKENMYKNNISKIIDAINRKAKNIDNKRGLQLYNFYKFLFDEYGLDNRYIKPEFEKDQRYILDTNLNDFITKARINDWFKNKTVNHVGSGLGRNLPLLVYLGCTKVIGMDVNNNVFEISQEFIRLFKFKKKIELINEDFLNCNSPDCDVFYYIGGTININTSEDKINFYIAMNKILKTYNIIVYTKDLFQSFNDFEIIENMLKNNKRFEKLYNNSGFYIYQRK